MNKFLKLLGIHRPDEPPVEATAGRILLVGSPNVGKSLIFNRLTGQYATVSNYPGTTVEVARGYLKTTEGTFEILDTPGIYSLNPITSEEKVTYDLLFADKVRAVVHVTDAKNLDRMLPLTLQLAEAGLPVVLVLNMIDEAQDLGMTINTPKLRELLQIPVIETTATTGYGLHELKQSLSGGAHTPDVKIDYGPELEPAIRKIAGTLEPHPHISPRTMALLLLQSDETALGSLLKEHSLERTAGILKNVAEAQKRLDHPAHYYAAYAVKQRVQAILGQVLTLPPPASKSFREQLSRALMRPVLGIPVLVIVLYFGLYKFVGSFGAGMLVDWIQTWFTSHISPWADRFFAAIIPWQTLRDLFTGTYGIVPLALRYAIAIIFPIVGTFFIAFSLLEDSGYLPRLAMLIDRLFKRIGLNGRAVIPIVLGFGCGTMATMVTRTLETKRERVIATFLLALAIPCSAQMGVILGLLSKHPGALLAWIGFVLVVFLVAGFLASRLVPGKGPSFYMELPPLRLPKISNVTAKTVSRMTWYFKEVLPLFILASVFIWLGQITGIFQLLIRGLEPVALAMGLPAEAASIFLFGFFRRDYGAAGLYDLTAAGLMNGNQLAVAAIALTLFLPCIAQFLIMAKERGSRTSFAIAGLTAGLAFAGGYLANLIITTLGVNL